ncbi:MAG: hypothetical protein ABR577_01020 [Pyrinomonadaceae bacterium]
MRRIFSGLLAGLLTFAICASLIEKKTHQPIVHTSGGYSYTTPGHDLMRSESELYSSSSEATDHFNTELQKAAHLAEFTPCFDTSGRRIGERAVVWFFSPQAPEESWRIMWTQRAEDSSEFFLVESSSLSDARYLETIELQRWKKCAAKK